MPSESPPSASSFWINLSGCVCFFLYLIFITHFMPEILPGSAAIGGILATLIPILIGEIFILKVTKRSRDTYRPPSPIEMIKSIALRVYFFLVMFMFYLMYVTQILTPTDPAIQHLYADSFSLTPTAIINTIIFSHLFLMCVDVLFATIGYVLASRTLDSHIRSTDPTLFGWAVGLICYAPFWDILIISIGFDVFFDENHIWRVWLADEPVLMIVWGLLIVVAQGIESSSTMTFGIRFSNLTWRGLISGGPFRYSKHPQYISKMCNRFLVYVPFLGMGSADETVHTLIIFMSFCVIYFFRARTEERHLSRYPEYVAYANWINEHGIFRFIGQAVPPLRYNEVRAKSGRLI